MSFKNHRALSAAFEDGKYWISSFRKVPASTATVTGQWYDYSYASGNPIPNYYAASPLVAATLEPDKGIIVPRMSGTSKQYLHRLSVMSNGTTAGTQPIYLLDYLLYYPFVDMDAAGEQQDMTNSVELPRYNVDATWKADSFSGAGSFSSATGWTQQAMWSIGSGVATATPNASSDLIYDAGVTRGKRYLVSFDVVSVTAGGVRPWIGGAGTTRSAVGSYSEILTAGDTYCALQGLSTFAGSVDNFTIREWESGGDGAQMMVVAQSPTVGGGRFTINYQATDGFNYTTESMFCGASQPSGALVNAITGTSGLTPFVPLNAGVVGVKQVNWVNFSVANGGLCAVVLVKPLETTIALESTSVAGIGSAVEKEALRLRGGIVEIKDGAFLGFLGQGVAGSLASSPLVGTIETVWS